MYLRDKVQMAPHISTLDRFEGLQWIKAVSGLEKFNWKKKVVSDEKNLSLDQTGGLAYYWQDIRRENSALRNASKGVKVSWCRGRFYIMV